jgi:hypothetical protein
VHRGSHQHEKAGGVRGRLLLLQIGRARR